MQDMHTSYGCSRPMWQEFAFEKGQHNSIGICMHSNQTCRYAYSRLKPTHKVTTHNTHTELMTHMVCMYICTPQVLLILSPMDNSLLHCIYPVYLFCICCQSTQVHRYSYQVCHKHHSHKVGHKQLKKEPNRWQHE